MILSRSLIKKIAGQVNAINTSRYLKKITSGDFLCLHYANSIQSSKYFSGFKQMEDEYVPSAPAVGGKENGVEKKPKGNKRLSVERIYQKKSQLEHILLRPDTYIGSVQPVTEKMWVYDEVVESLLHIFVFHSIRLSRHKY